MKKNILNSFLFLSALTLTVACKTKKVVVVVPPVTDAIPVTLKDRRSENLDLLKSKDVSFNTLSLKGKARLAVNGNVNNVSMTVRMKKDEVIWVSITAIAGIEVARAMITPDSVKLMNKLQGTYINQPFNYLHRYSSKQLDFKLLQSIFAGNTIADFMVERSALELENGVWVLSGEKRDLGYKVLFNTLLKVTENNLNDLKSGQALKVVYGDYQDMSEALFPTSVKISSMAGSQRINLDIDFSKTERNLPVEFPFNVPKKYEVLN